MSAQGFALTTARLELRLPRDEDLAALGPIFADPLVMRYVGDGSVRTPERVRRGMEYSRALFAERRLGVFTAVERSTGVIIGDGLVVPILRSGADPADVSARGPQIEVGYRLGRAHWGRGYATEIARALVGYGLASDGAAVAEEELVAVTHPGNAASQRVLMKAGMTPKGLTNRYYGMACALFGGPFGRR